VDCIGENRSPLLVQFIISTKWRNEREKYFLERKFFVRTDIPQLAKLASDSRGSSRESRLGVRCLGTLKYQFQSSLTMRVERVVNMANANVHNEDNEYLKSEYDFMVYLHNLGNVPVSKWTAHALTAEFLPPLFFRA